MATANDVIRLAYGRLNDSVNGDGRYGYGIMMEWLTVAGDQYMRDTKFPWVKCTTKSVPNLQAYQLPEIIEPVRVYVQGRIYIPKTLDTIEGVQINVWDQTGFGPPPVPGSAAPAGSTGVFAPQWSVVTPQALPTCNEYGEMFGYYAAPTYIPYSCGQRPQWYADSGYLVLVPAPSMGPPVINGQVCDNIEVLAWTAPDPITDLNQNLWFPRAAVSPLAWWIVQEARNSEETAIASTLADKALANYNKEMKQRANDIKRFLEGGAVQGINFQTQRTYYPGHTVRRGGGMW